ncbi:MAG: fibrobacter succinogenes major paralogous domain-containing protein [Candidatus Peribacteria bacterium]|nr:fibrobacter succinogenes major paralogous domain-containing protein [Candidatus Peribacteria bacterium]
MGERNQLLIVRASVNGVSLTDSSGYKYFSDATGTKKFRDYFLLPLAGYRYFDSSAPVHNQGNYGRYWSSSPNGSTARNLRLDTSNVRADHSSARAYGFSVRCFKNS